MADKIRARRKSASPEERRTRLREELWPGSSQWIWDPSDKEKTVGYTNITRLMPLVLHLIKKLAKDRSKSDPSPVYFELWCRDFGQGVISIQDEEECAYASGYDSTRALRTWREHMLTLQELGFIQTRQEGLREYANVLLLNPLAVCVRLRQEGKTPEAWWGAFYRRSQDVGAPLPEAVCLGKEPDPKQE